MQYRELGATCESVSIIGFGGIVVKDLSQAEADAAVAEALHRGVNYFDVAPSYGDAEERLGGALLGKRDEVFLACKTGLRTKQEAAAELDRTLARLHTDHADLYQMHGLDSSDDLATALAPGGAMEAFEEARLAGKVRFIGITGHSTENLATAISSGRFDTVLYPVNFAQFEMANYGPELLSLAKEKGVGRLAIKAAAKEPWGDSDDRVFPKCWYKPLSEKGLFALAIRYALSQDISAALPPGDLGLFKMALDIAEDFRPLDESELQELRESSGQFTPLFGKR